MGSTEKIRKRVSRRQELRLFTIASVQKNDNYGTISKEFSRMVSEGQIRRLERGIYYKPKATKFGEMAPTEQDVLRFLLHDNKGKQVGYVSGARAYNSLGLTTQISNTITIAAKDTRPKKRSLGRFSIKYVKAYGNPSKDKYNLLQILDAIKDIKIIPDTSISESIEILKRIVDQLPKEDQGSLYKLAKKYPKEVEKRLSNIIQS